MGYSGLKGVVERGGWWCVKFFQREKGCAMGRQGRQGLHTCYKVHAVWKGFNFFDTVCGKEEG